MNNKTEIRFLDFTGVDSIRLNMSAKIAAGLLAGRAVDVAKITNPKHQKEFARHVVSIVDALVLTVMPDTTATSKSAPLHDEEAHGSKLLSNKKVVARKVSTRRKKPVAADKSTDGESSFNPILGLDPYKIASHCVAGGLKD